MDTVLHAILLVGFALVSVAAARHFRKPAARVVGDAKQGDQLTDDPGSVPPCIICSEPSLFQLPHLEERRGLLDSAAFDVLWRRLGVRREVQFTVVLERPIWVQTNVCEACHRIARAKCELYVAELQGRRAATAVEEAAAVADFLDFGLIEHARSAVVERARRRRTAPASDEGVTS